MQEQLNLFPDMGKISLEEVFDAYYECRRHKRKTLNALAFEVDLEKNVIELWRQINDGTYQVGRSVAFIVEKPVKREIFAADFRDRVVHHLIIRKLHSLFEEHFNPNSYSCRPGKGSLYGVRAVYQHMKDCSKNFSTDCYVMRLDICAFFMSINHHFLYQKLTEFVRRFYRGCDKDLLLHLIQLTVFNHPQKGCLIKGKKESWNTLPTHKSLFKAKGNKGLPIGNLTSQIFANFYLNEFDNWVSAFKGLYYGRYVDDLVFMHPSKDFLLWLRRKIAFFMEEKLDLMLHPFKFFLQHYAKGFAFIGWYFKPFRVGVSRRFKNSFFSRIFALNTFFKRKVGCCLLKRTLCVLNSYLGFLRHFQNWRLRLKGWNLLSLDVRHFFKTDTYILKVSCR